LTELISSTDTSRNDLLKVAAGGILSGIATPLTVPMLDRLNAFPGQLGVAMVGLPFAILVCVLVRRFSKNPLWAVFAAGLVSMFAFVCAVNAAVWVDGQAGGLEKFVRNVLSGFSGGFAGTTVMALGIRMLPAGPRDAQLWLPMVGIGTAAGSLLALDNALNLDLTSVLYPIWQAGVGLALARVLQRRAPAR
jgi:hypothetical protein